MARVRRRRPAGWRERGAIGALVAVLAPAIIGLAGLVFDGGLALEARQRGLDVAEQAARAAANNCDEQVLRTDSDCVISDATVGKAQADAAAFMANGVTMTGFSLDDNGHTVVVTVRVHSDTTFLKMFGVGGFDIDLPARRATAVTGLAG